VSAPMSLHVRSEVKQLADLLLDDVERIAELSVVRMQELLPSYAKVPAKQLTPLAFTSTRNLLEAVRDPDTDPIRAEGHFRVLGETRLSQGIAADEMLQGWRILLEVARKEAHPAAIRLGVGDDVLLDFVEVTLQWGDRGMSTSAAAYREAEIGELERLAAEKDALRRVAVMVATGSSPDEVFDRVAMEVGLLLRLEGASIDRFESDGSSTVVACWGRLRELYRVGSRWKLDDDSASRLVRTTGRSARFDAYEHAWGPVEAEARRLGLSSAVASPILVNGRLWGTIFSATSDENPMPTDAQLRIAEFSELVATAISNVQAQGEVERLLDEQAALRRVATLVAQDVASDDLFGAVAEEVGRLFAADYTGMIRYGPDPTFVTTIATWAAVGEHPPGPTRFRTVPGDPTAMIADAGTPARVDDWTNVPGPIAEFIRGELGVKSSVASPIVVNGSLWGALALHSKRGPLSPATESRLLSFTELVATAIANTSARAEVSRLAAEQAALRRVATLVAVGDSPSAVLDAVAAEMERALGADGAMLLRYEPDDEVTVVACIPNEPGLPPGTRISHKGHTVSALVRRSGQPARIADYQQARGPLADAARAAEWKNGAVGTPITVDGRLWGVIIANWRGDGSPPADTEERMTRFAQLLATAIANADSGEALRRLAEQQAALRRVATLVAREASQAEVFTAIAEEIGQVLEADEMWMIRHERDTEAVEVAAAGPHPDLFPVGVRWPLGGENVASRVFRTGQPARIDDYAKGSGPIAEALRSMGIRGVVGTPILVRGQLWGTMQAGTFADKPLSRDTQSRLGQFTELMATAIANAEARAEVRRLADESRLAPA
jgi:GAF domain-containing protein